MRGELSALRSSWRFQIPMFEREWGLSHELDLLIAVSMPLALVVEPAPMWAPVELRTPRAPCRATIGEVPKRDAHSGVKAGFVDSRIRKARIVVVPARYFEEVSVAMDHIPHFPSVL
jgi:hypothetical protein